MTKPVSRFVRTLGIVLGLLQILPANAADLFGPEPARDPKSIAAQPVAPAGAGTIAPYRPRFGRSRPLIAVVGENRGTETVDFMVPYGILSRSGVADVVAVATRSGPIQMFPVLSIEPGATTTVFDARYPEGADYVVVPAVMHPDDSALLAWVTAQATKGGTIVGICDGAFVLGNAGLLKGHQATGHWFTQKLREKKYPETHWRQDTRYVSDRSIVTTSGVTAAIPVSVALVEAMAGRGKAEQLALELGVRDWSPVHRTAPFRFGTGRTILALGRRLAFWSRATVGIPVTNGMDEVALALVADAYARTNRSRVLTVGETKMKVRTRGGLTIIPDAVTAGLPALARMLPALGSSTAVSEFEGALTGIAGFYGRATATRIAVQMEYPRP